MRAIALYSAVPLIVLTLGCASTQSKWEEASAKNTLYAYSQFLRENPTSDYSARAREKIEELTFLDAKRFSANYSMPRFLQQYPNSKYALQARELIEIEDRAELARNKTVPSYERFLSKHPSGASAQSVREELRAMEVSSVRRVKSAKGYQAIISKYPSHPDSIKLAEELPQMVAWEPHRLLAEIVIRAAPTQILAISGGGTGQTQVAPAGLQRSASEQEDLLQLRQLLASGSDPNKVRISGYFAPSATFLFGESGYPALPSDRGMTLVEYCRATKSSNVLALLESFGAR